MVRPASLSFVNIKDLAGEGSEVKALIKYRTR